jgi:hypothetical protein
LFSQKTKEEGKGMELSEVEVNQGEKVAAYQREATAIEARLRNGVPEGKREKLKFRLKDIEERLIPELVSQMQLF